MSDLLDLPRPITHADLMLAGACKARFSAPGWIYELKYDGFRCLASKRHDVVRMESRTGRDLSTCFPEVAAVLAAIPHDFTIDSELVILDELGRPVWERLKARHALKNAQRIREAAARDPAVIFAFDVAQPGGLSPEAAD